MSIAKKFIISPKALTRMFIYDKIKPGLKNPNLFAEDREMSENTVYKMPKKDRIVIGAYMPISHCDEQHVKDLADAGVDYAVLNMDRLPVKKHEELFKWLNKYGVEATVRLEKLMKYYKNAGMLDLSKKDEMFFIDEPSFVSFCYIDEPGMEHFEELGKEIELFKKEFPDKQAYVNLLPMYANKIQLIGGAWKAPIEYYDDKDASYQDYLDAYIANVDTDYICTDIYPCRRIANPACPDKFPAEYIKVTYGNYVKSIEIVANACRKSGRDFWCCIQSCTWHEIVREPDGSEVRWQAYTMLSYGAKALLYYVFACRKGHSGTIMNEVGLKTKLYFESQKLMMGIKKLSDLYLTYKNVGAFNLNSTPETTPYLEMDTPYTDFKAIKDIKCNTPLLVGCFEKKEGEGSAFTLVNMQDFETPGTARAVLKIDGKVTIYRDGEPEELTAVNGSYEILLEQGDGVFVTVE